MSFLQFLQLPKIKIGFISSKRTGGAHQFFGKQVGKIGKTALISHTRFEKLAGQTCSKPAGAATGRGFARANGV